MGLLPFYHIYGLSVLVFSLPIMRARVVTLPAFEPTSFLSAIQTYKMTMMHLVPPLVIFLAKHPLVDNYDLSSVRTILSGAAPLGKDTEAAFSQRTGVVDLRQGQLQASSLIFCLSFSLTLSLSLSLLNWRSCVHLKVLCRTIL